MSLRLLIVLAAICWFTGAKGGSDLPNVLLVVADDLRPTLGCYGDPIVKSPNIDSFAASGVLFTHAYAQQALCGPSRTSFLTSRRPDTLKQIDVHHYWRRHAGNFSTLPQYFRRHAYHTASVGKVFHPGIASNHNDDAELSWSVSPYHPSSEKHKQDPVCLGDDGKLHTNVYCPVEVSRQPEGTLPDIQTTQFTLKWLKERAANNTSDEPFLLAVGFHKPHIPLKFPKQFSDVYPIDRVPLAPHRRIPRNLPLTAWNPWNDLRKRDDIQALNVSFPFGPIPDYYSRYIRQGYFSSITYIDFLFGLILQEVNNLFPNTIVILLSDHGWSLGEHQEWSKFSNYEVATRVPWIIGRPVVPSIPFEYGENISECMNMYLRYLANGVLPHHTFQKVDELVELVDLFPTVVDLVGLPQLSRCSTALDNDMACTEGMSQACHVTRIRDPFHDCPKKNFAISQYPRPQSVPSRNPDSDQPRLIETTIMGYSVRTRRFRNTTWVKFNHSSFRAEWKHVYGRELYDHYHDPEELFNLAPQHWS